MGHWFRLYSHWYKHKPFPTNGVTSLILFGAGDVVAQNYFDPRYDHESFQVDSARMVRHALYGALFFSPVAVLWYRITLPRIPNPVSSLGKYLQWDTQRIRNIDTVYRVFLDQAFSPTLLWVPLYAIGSNILNLTDHPFERAKNTLKDKWWISVKNFWIVWPTFQLINFSTVPPHFRLLAANFWLIVWNCYLCYNGLRWLEIH